MKKHENNLPMGETNSPISSRRFWKKPGFVITAIVLVIVVIAAAGYSAYAGWLYQQPKFHDVTMELGEEMPDFQAFMTEYAKAEKVRIVTEAVDLTVVGTHELVFAHNGKEETVNLTIEDTTAPKVEFRDLNLSILDEVELEDLVVSVEELSDYTITGQLPKDTATYSEVIVPIQVTDAYGNTTEGECKISYRWMKEQFNLELGHTLRSSMIIYGATNESVSMDESQIEAINASPVGEYSVVSYLGDAVNECVITVRDTTAPNLRLQSVTIYPGDPVSLEDFVVSATDISGEVTTRLTEPLPLEEAGDYTVAVEAEDIYGNIVVKEAILHVILDTEPPEFAGVGVLPVEKGGTPDYYTGVTAIDARDGKLPFHVDTSRVNTSKAGTYYAVYSATDKSGNAISYRRRISVIPSAEDTDELAISIAAGLSNDVEAIRDYVRNSIAYSYSWGGDDPVWYGFTERSGNCYVHARCFQALLRAKGYESMIIWVKNQTHYWNLVKINGVWRHMDATPGSANHARYSIMTDEMRYETLSGRDWDRNAWPAAE